MEALLIPMDVTSTSYFTQTVTLSGRVFKFTFMWNERDGHFFMDVATNGGIQRGIRLVPNSPLLGTTEVTDKGEFYLLSSDAKANADNIGYFDYGNVWNLFFVPEA